VRLEIYSTTYVAVSLTHIVIL